MPLYRVLPAYSILSAMVTVTTSRPVTVLLNGCEVIVSLNQMRESSEGLSHWEPPAFFKRDAELAAKASWRELKPDITSEPVPPSHISWRYSEGGARSKVHP